MLAAIGAPAPERGTMAEEQPAKAVRVLTATVSGPRSRLLEEIATVLREEVTAAGFTLVRHVVVKGEAQFVQQLVSNVSTDNEADAVIIVGGAGFGPRDHLVEALESTFERRIEGFGEAYRRLLRADLGVHALLSRATAGTFNQCLVFALSGRAGDVRLAMQTLIAPVLPEAVELALGRPRPKPSS
jgi:molybdenum cofactor biosynthesis protein B